jgi:hypothetical protein
MPEAGQETKQIKKLKKQEGFPPAFQASQLTYSLLP